MTQRELESWQEFYRMHPFDDHYRYHRGAALIATAMGGGEVQARLDWLSPMPEPVPEGWSAADAATFKALGVTPPKKG